MCEFCHTHGEGEKWYLKAENYAEDLLSDLRRRKFINDFFKYPENLGKKVASVDDLDKLPKFVRNVVSPILSNREKKTHFGQVIPIEDVEKIFEFVNSVIRLPCICRKVSVGEGKRYCYGISMVPSEESEMGKIIRSIGADYLTGPDTLGLEEVPKEVALQQFKEMENKGLFHSAWTFVAPFIGGLCNCDRDCLAMQVTKYKSFPVMFRAEYVAEVNPDLCNGCQSCIRVCQFGALRYSMANEKVDVDPLECYGCGVCRSSCSKNAIALNDRNKIPTVANLW